MYRENDEHADAWTETIGTVSGFVGKLVKSETT